MTDELTYDDYKRRISIRDILKDAGYTFNKSDGMRYPTYSRKDSEGKNIKGDKFIITANGLCCFHPSEYKNYNIIGFIKAHPEMFSDYTPGMNLDLLVNKVCCRLLNEPTIQNRKSKQPTTPQEVKRKEFNMCAYTTKTWKEDDFESQKPFYPYFSSRGINRETQRAFSASFFIATSVGYGKPQTRCLSFPMRIPGSPKIVGLEMRGIPNNQGISFKGMAQNTNATQGMWMASPDNDITKPGQFSSVRNVYWFESAYDAMAFYQLKANKEEMKNTLFVSTGGSPSMQQFRGLLEFTGKASHHLCFDQDLAGRLYAINFAIARLQKEYITHIATLADEQAGIATAGQLVIENRKDNGERFTLNMDPFDFGRICSVLDINKPDMKDYLASLKDKSAMKSGDFNLLPSDSFSGRLYSEMESLSEALHTGEIFYGVPPEQRKAIRESCEKEYKELYNVFTSALIKDIRAFRSPGGSTVYQPCSPRFKDYNDQLQNIPKQDSESADLASGKKQMTSEDIIESSLDGIDGIYEERSESHEEEEASDQERKSRYRR